ncbi:putative manganese efflux pump MntP [Aquimixticola soesokkakensis]|uniref:Putative manganese efflux pump MntP n=1 Tax=Aquimixticola soesokkakensis TaxID=1519096 RepID=A0A1Y5TXW3_9RHOB|nr:manganese efflux pump MntP family protein [Aquimixticola soesokkakensis]SLN70645.1 putative manganese efflux pump MntP [Aquimixticola soesokkakensis]
MSPISIGVLAISMSVDAFIASVGKGASGPRPSFGHTLRTGMIFGFIEALTPLIGWGVGMAASQYVAAVDHWIAFILLSGVGLHMALHAGASDEEAASTSMWKTIVTAVGTSIDAMAVGVSLAFLQVNIFVIALAVGATTMLMSSTGLLVGRFVGRRFGRIAEIIGGAALVGLGSLILWEHLSAA